jgi:putative Mg2+ transporter-C (MgtC) family protein
VCPSSDERTIRTALMQQVNAQSNMLVQAIATKATEQSDRLSVVAEISSNIRNDHAMQDVLSAINAEPRIFAASWERLR